MHVIEAEGKAVVSAESAVGLWFAVEDRDTLDGRPGGVFVMVSVGCKVAFEAGCRFEGAALVWVGVVEECMTGGERASVWFVMNFWRRLQCCSKPSRGHWDLGHLRRWLLYWLLLPYIGRLVKGSPLYMCRLSPSVWGRSALHPPCHEEVCV